MTDLQYILNKLDARRMALGMSYEILAHRCGLGPRTVRRVLQGDVDPGFSTVNSIAKVLGVEVRMGTKLGLARAENIDEMRRRQAKAKAEKLVGMVQGNSALEGQAVGKGAVRDMIQRTVFVLLNGSDSRLWSA